MSPGDEGDASELRADDAPLFNAESISESASLSALLSDEEIVPAETSELSSLCSRLSGEENDGE
jgi:hypothetical protein